RFVLVLELFFLALGRKRTLADVVDLVALLDLEIGQLRVDRSADVAGQRPGSRRPDQQVLSGPIAQRQTQEDGLVSDNAIALVHLHLGKTSPAARTPRHSIISAVNQPA